MLPDSNIDIGIVSGSIMADTVKLVQALTVSMKYEAIISTTNPELTTIEFKHTYSGLSIHIDISSSCDTSISNFIRYAKRVKGYKSLYMLFRYFIRQFNITCDSTQKIIIHLLVIYYLQITLE